MALLIGAVALARIVLRHGAGAALTARLPTPNHWRIRCLLSLPRRRLVFGSASGAARRPCPVRDAASASPVTRKSQTSAEARRAIPERADVHRVRPDGVEAATAGPLPVLLHPPARPAAKERCGSGGTAGSAASSRALSLCVAPRLGPVAVVVRPATRISTPGACAIVSAKTECTRTTAATCAPAAERLNRTSSRWTTLMAGDARTVAAQTGWPGWAGALPQDHSRWLPH